MLGETASEKLVCQCPVDRMDKYILACDLCRPRLRRNAGNSYKSMPNDLLEETLTLLNKRPSDLKLRAIAREAGLQASWISALHLNQIKEPSIIKVQKLYNYLIQHSQVSNVE